MTQGGIGEQPINLAANLARSCDVESNRVFLRCFSTVCSIFNTKTRKQTQSKRHRISGNYL
jgi:hypothetical protein